MYNNPILTLKPLISHARDGLLSRPFLSGSWSIALTLSSRKIIGPWWTTLSLFATLGSLPGGFRETSCKRIYGAMIAWCRTAVTGCALHFNYVRFDNVSYLDLCDVFSIFFQTGIVHSMKETFAYNKHYYVYSFHVFMGLCFLLV